MERVSRTSALRLALLVGAVACAARPPTIGERYGSYPFLTPRDAPPTVALVAGGELAADPATCGACHGAVLEEWRQTTHAAAAVDPQYVAELAKPTSPRWLCLNCHVPTSPQRPDLVTLDTRFATPDSILHLQDHPNPAHDPTRAGEGIGCPTCHVRRDEDGAGVVVAPAASGRAPHRVREDRAALDGGCVTCHSPGEEVVITPQFFCWFHTAEELASGPQAGAACVDCHMPIIGRPVATDAPPRLTRRHQWAGGGVPKEYAGFTTLEARGWEPGFEVELGVVTGGVEVGLVNRAGHALPTADPERHLRVEVRFEDAAGTLLTRELRRVGQRWDWGDAATGRPARRLADERVPPGGSLRWTVTTPPGAERVTVEVAHVRLTVENAGWLAQVSVDDALAALAPGAREKLPELHRHYPLGAFVHRETLSLRDGARSVVPLATLLAESAAMAEAPVEAKRARFAVE